MTARLRNNSALTMARAAFEVLFLDGDVALTWPLVHGDLRAAWLRTWLIDTGQAPRCGSAEAEELVRLLVDDSRTEAFPAFSAWLLARYAYLLSGDGVWGASTLGVHGVDLELVVLGRIRTADPTRFGETVPIAPVVMRRVGNLWQVAGVDSEPPTGEWPPIFPAFIDPGDPTWDEL